MATRDAGSAGALIPELLYRAMEWDGTVVLLLAIGFVCLLVVNVHLYRIMRRVLPRIEGAEERSVKAYRRTRRLQRNSERTTQLKGEAPDSSRP